jgi:1-acyl-sn-glycerol-3-phosphate acyltransferase
MKHNRSLGSRCWYDGLKVLCRLLATLGFRYRALGIHHVPRSGGALVVSNHQSHFDPVIVGVPLGRRLNYVARQSLFRFAPFRWLIRSLDAIPLDREGLGLAGMKETMRRLKNGEMVLIFPEGTRTSDGELGPIKPGFGAIVRRTRVAILPVGMDGAYQCWPRSKSFPGFGIVRVVYGRPIRPEDFESWSDERLLAEVEARMKECLAAAKAFRGRASP